MAQVKIESHDMKSLMKGNPVLREVIDVVETPIEDTVTPIVAPAAVKKTSRRTPHARPTTLGIPERDAGGDD